ncbi:hypothetical protein GLOIN_2v1779794 [Rhizophagus irregularis DAOM 181602=DAOM 197198]|uniref:NAD(P)-binding protein n=1 Tax=Rhizophagus irregularis (strain DAOM 181602 / DAOM 197198 / MUCL 43194) TaxID=747089 RepID=A0A2P4PP42_RHIID|nr:hypothetical protein GLOIN_2v1779794 [Rhizophagus irregularis DAOM 181602=DAOM 197198]POG67137.1 hypothetical protein GLOIN_2v1779794 [Rhizophagus irregularis DAOM 181602=DAOM 197198]|eukprot:XP_025174003.1 hypothetical protein GLOIN_2v1779794 [Rhizophagus irregularis DAOM 181602=DAOM 197198]
MKEENVIADVNEDASEKIAKEFNVNKWNELISLFDKTKQTFGQIDYLKQNNPQGGISIINTASITAIRPVFTFGVYSATKAGYLILSIRKLKFLIIGGHQLMSSYFKCIYNPKLNGTIFSVWNKKMREEKFENPTPVIEEMIQGNYIKYFIMKFSLFPILLK